MSTPNGMKPSFKVAYSEAVKNALKDLVERAAREGYGKQILAALKTIDEQLRSNARKFGDPLYNLPKAKLQMMHRLLAPLVVYYAVHLEKPVVIVRRFKPFPSDAF
jgi:hypothetical protein